MLLLGEVRLRRHELPEARALLGVELPAGPDFDLLRARRQFLLGFDQLLAGDRKAAAATFDRAGSLTPAGADLRLDIDVYAGIASLQLGEWEKGESRLNDVLQAAAKSGDRYHQAVALLNLGYGQLVQKRYDAALTWLERVLALEDLRDLTVYGDALNNAGICYARLGLFDRAVAAQRQAIERHKGGASRQYEQALGQLGTTYLDAGNDREGVDYLRQALDVASKAGLPADAGLWAGNLAAAHVKAGRLDEAERFNDDAKRFKGAAGSSGTVYNTLRAGEIAQRRGQLADASRMFNDALAASPDDPSVKWSAHEGLAQVAIAARRPPEAMRHFAAALDTVEKTRSDLMRTDYKLSYLTRLIDFYRVYVDALVDQGQVERALEIADSSRGRVLAERQGVPATAAVGAGTLRQRAAESGTVFLSYWLAPARSYLWVVTPARVQLFTLPPAREIEELVRQHQAAIDNVVVGSADILRRRRRSALRHPRPARTVIKFPAGSRVLIVPDASLYALNFETLPRRVRLPTADCRLPTTEPPLPHRRLRDGRCAVVGDAQHASGAGRSAHAIAAAHRQRHGARAGVSRPEVRGRRDGERRAALPRRARHVLRGRAGRARGVPRRHARPVFATSTSPRTRPRTSTARSTRPSSSAARTRRSSSTRATSPRCR